MTRQLFAPVVVLFAVLLVATPAAAHHTTPYQVDTVFYYNSCPLNGAAVGVRADHCGSGVTTVGTLNGHWKEVEVEDCYMGPGTPPTGHNHMHYYEKCDGVWVEVTPEAFFEGTCSC